MRPLKRLREAFWVVGVPRVGLFQPRESTPLIEARKCPGARSAYCECSLRIVLSCRVSPALLSRLLSTCSR